MSIDISELKIDRCARALNSQATRDDNHSSARSSGAAKPYFAQWAVYDDERLYRGVRRLSKRKERTHHLLRVMRIYPDVAF